MVRPNRRWKMCAARGEMAGKASGQRKKQTIQRTNHSRTNADVAVADVAVAVSKCRRAPIHREAHRLQKLQRECKTLHNLWQSISREHQHGCNAKRYKARH